MKINNKEENKYKYKCSICPFNERTRCPGRMWCAKMIK